MPLRLPTIKLPNINHKLAAVGAFVVLGVAAVGAIQVFGDPAAAGPRRIVSLEPSQASAETAPRMSPVLSALEIGSISDMRARWACKHAPA